MDDFEERVRKRAHKIWTAEGCPEGRADIHWHMARELVAIEDNFKTTLQPIATEAEKIGNWGEPVEPALAAENIGEMPTLADQGEQQYPPHRPTPEGQQDVSPAPKPGTARAQPAAQKRLVRTHKPTDEAPAKQKPRLGAQTKS